MISFLGGIIGIKLEGIAALCLGADAPGAALELGAPKCILCGLERSSKEASSQGSLMLAPQPCFWSYLGFIPKADLRVKGFYLRGFFGRHRNRGFYLL